LRPSAIVGMTMMFSFTRREAMREKHSSK